VELRVSRDSRCFVPALCAGAAGSVDYILGVGSAGKRGRARVR
jgi:hypothetical protein